MRFIYEFLKTIVKIALWIYYRKITVVNGERLQFKGPAIVVSNHPCTLMDPLNVGARAREPFYFLANAGLFKSKFGNWFFNTFYCIPIERMQDTSGKPVNNAAAFARCDAHMVQGGTLFIAPEGDSWMRRHLHKLKTGTVRIAFNSEALHEYNLDLKIVPVGLTYSDPTAFRGEVFINVGEYLYVKDFKENYEKDPIEATKAVTQMLEERLRTLTIDTIDDDEDLFIKQLEEILHNNQPLQPEAAFHRTKKLITALREWKTSEGNDYHNFQQEVNSYFTILKQQNISDDAVVNGGAGLFVKILLPIIGVPIFLYGSINHFLAAGIPFLVAWLLVKRLKLYIGYTSTIKYAVGILTVPLFYGLQSECIEKWFSTEVSWWYLLSLPIAGLLAWEYWVLAKRVMKRLSFRFLKDKEELKESRERIVSRISIFL